jgi:site-specific recombinase XerD
MVVPDFPPPDGLAPDPKPPKLLERMRIHLRTRHYSIRTEQAYLDWARRFILYHNKRHPQEMGAREVEAFLSHLAVDRQVSASTQNQAKAAILYLYRQVLAVELPWLDEVVQAKRPRRLPVVLTPAEVRLLLMHMDGTMGLIAQLLYGAGMRLMEALRLRVKDVEFARREIVIREGKGAQAGVTARAAPFVRHASAAIGLRHPHGARAARPRGCEHDDDLHAGAGQGRAGRVEPARCLVMAARREVFSPPRSPDWAAPPSAWAR